MQDLALHHTGTRRIVARPPTRNTTVSGAMTPVRSRALRLARCRPTPDQELGATRRPFYAGTAERKKVLAGILAFLGELTSAPGQEPAAWVAGSLLVEVVFDS